jgi:hypothetical protein
MRNPKYSFVTAARLMIALLFFVTLKPASAQTNPLAAAASLEGTYADGALTLVLTGKPGAYSGSLTLQGNTFPVTATSQGSAVRGTFSANGQNFPFTAQWNGTELLLESAGNNFRLRRETPAARNPLDGAASSPQSASAAQPVEAGEFQLRLPAGWTAKAGSDGDVALLPPGFNPQNVTELYMLAALGYDSLRDPQIIREIEDDFIPEAARRAARKATAALQLPGRTGVVHTWKFQRPDNGQAITVAAYLVESSGQVLQILATASGDLPSSRHEELQQIAASLQLGATQASAQPAAAPRQRQATANPAPAGTLTGIQTHPQAPPIVPGQLSDNNPQSLQWLNHLRGKMLSRYDRGSSGLSGGWTSQEKMLLFPDGRFAYSTSNQFSIDTGGAFGSGAGRDGKSGTWRILTANGTSFLALVYQGSNVEEYAELDLRDNKTFLDGSRVLVTAPQ